MSGELEGSELGYYGTEAFSYGDMSVGHVDGELEEYPVGEK